MLAILAGTPGSGKSLKGVGLVFRAAKRLDRQIFCDIDGVWDSRYRIMIAAGHDPHLADKWFLSPWHDDARSIPVQPWECPDNVLFVLDEVQDRWNTRAFATDENKLASKWIGTHRHHGHDVYMITQHPEFVDKQIRGRCEMTYYLVRTRFLGFDRGIVERIYLGGEIENRRLISAKAATLDKSLFSLYKSFDSGATEKQEVKVPPTMARMLVLGLFFVAVVAVVMVRKVSELAQPPAPSKPVAAKIEAQNVNKNLLLDTAGTRGTICFGGGCTVYR